MQRRLQTSFQEWRSLIRAQYARLDDIAAPKRPLYRDRSTVSLDRGKNPVFPQVIGILPGPKSCHFPSNCKRIIELEGFEPITNLELLFLFVLR